MERCKVARGGSVGWEQRRPCDRRAQKVATPTITSTFGVGTARSSASTRRSTSSAGKPPRAKQARPPRSSTARASRARKRGARIEPPGYDDGKKIKGKKRHILVDTQGLLMHAIVHAADVQDRDGADRATSRSYPGGRAASLRSGRPELRSGSRPQTSQWHLAR